MLTRNKILLGFAILLGHGESLGSHITRDKLDLGLVVGTGALTIAAIKQVGTVVVDFMYNLSRANSDLNPYVYKDLLGNSFSYISSKNTGPFTPDDVSNNAQVYAKKQMDSKYGDGAWSTDSLSASQSSDYSSFYQQYVNDIISKMAGVPVSEVEDFFAQQQSPSYSDALTAINGFCQEVQAIPGVDKGDVFKNLVKLGATEDTIDYIQSYLKVNGGDWPSSAAAPESGFVIGSGINYSSIKAASFENLEGQTVDVRAALLQSQIKGGTLTTAELRTQATNLQKFMETMKEDSAEAKEANDSLDAANKVLEANGEEPVGPVETAA